MREQLSQEVMSLEMGTMSRRCQRTWRITSIITATCPIDLIKLHNWCIIKTTFKDLKLAPHAPYSEKRLWPNCKRLWASQIVPQNPDRSDHWLINNIQSSKLLQAANLHYSIGRVLALHPYQSLTINFPNNHNRSLAQYLALSPQASPGNLQELGKFGHYIQNRSLGDNLVSPVRARGSFVSHQRTLEMSVQHGQWLWLYITFFIRKQRWLRIN